MIDTFGTGRFAARMKRCAWAIGLSAVLGALAFFVLSSNDPTRYVATAQLLFRDPQFDQKLFGSAYVPNSRDPAREASTNLRLVNLDVVAADAARSTGLSKEAVRSSVRIANQGDSDLIAIEATSRSADAAADLANSIADSYISFRRRADQHAIREARKLIEGSLDGLPSSASRQRRELSARATQLEALAALQTGNAELVQPARAPVDSASPRPVRSGVVGGLLGALVSLLASSIWARYGTRIKSVEEVGESFSEPVLGEVPRDESVRTNDTSLSPQVTDALQLFRARLSFVAVDSELQSVLFTSSASGEGKSTISWAFAQLVAPAANGKVLLIEADLRRPSLATRWDKFRGVGLAEVLAGVCPLQDAIRPTETEGLDVLPAGQVPPNPADLLRSKTAESILDLLAREYALLVIDSPPIGVVPDILPWLARVTVAIDVIRIGSARVTDHRKVLDQFSAAGAPNVAILANGVPRRRMGGYYYEPYGQAGSA